MDAGTTVDKVGLHLLEYLIINQYNFVDCHFFSVNHYFNKPAIVPYIISILNTYSYAIHIISFTTFFYRVKMLAFRPSLVPLQLPI